MSEETPEWLDPDLADVVSRQTYAGRGSIAGVERIPLAWHSDEGGDFCELGRILQDGMLQIPSKFRAAQVSYSFMEPDVIKAWHLHKRQDDLWFVPPHDRLLVGLLDVRRTSPTRGTQMRFALGAGRAELLAIPAGVAHGVANLSGRGASLIYFVTASFDATEPDEYRLPFDLMGADFWSVWPG